MLAFQSSLRASLSAGFAVAIAHLLRLQYPIYALIAAVVVSDLSPSQTRRLGLRRVVGSMVGAVVGAALSLFVSPSWWATGLTVLVAMFLSHLLRLQGAAKISGYVGGIIVLNHGSHPWSYALYRLIETVLGIIIAILVSLFPKLIRTDASRQQDS
jgi:uncharacterized membrane protein YgaE (UPF0421/DUF939 family)